jgi:zinc protease
MRLHIICLYVLLSAVFCTGAHAAAYETFTLDNGLEVVLIEKHDTPMVAVYAYVKTGPIYEDEYLGCGISHYAEHLVSGGTTSNRTEAESNALLKQLGDRVNAYTTLDHTCYHIETDRAHWPQAAALIADWLGQCALDEDEVAREKGVISQEIRMGMDEPGRTLWQLLQSTAYRLSPMRVPIIGYAENFARLTRADLQR